MKSKNSKSLNNTLKDKLKFDLDTKYQNRSNLVIEKNITPIKKKSENLRFSQTNHFQPKTNFSIYKNNTKNLGQNEDSKRTKNLHYTERNFQPQFTMAVSKDKIKKNSYLIDILNETDKSNAGAMSLSQSREKTNFLRTSQNSTTKEKNSMLKIKINHQHAKSSLIHPQHIRKTEVKETKNVKIAYTDLANHLKKGENNNNKKGGIQRLNKTTNVNIENHNQSVDQLMQSNPNFKITSRSNNNISNQTNSAISRSTTKDNTFSSSIKLSSNNISLKGKAIAVQIDNPEELHFYNVFLLQQTKALAYKFENLIADSLDSPKKADNCGKDFEYDFDYKK